MTTLRADLQIISGWIAPGSRVLDLGCGDGALLAHLAAQSGVTGYGLDIHPENVIACVAASVNVLQTNLDDGIDQFADHSFDYVVMSSAIQEVRQPDMLIEQMLRIGKQGIVTFPNMGHWRPRMSLGLHGLMPTSKALPNAWYTTPNIHLCTVRDFEQLCRDNDVRITRRQMVNHAHRSHPVMRLAPNLLGEIALYELRNGQG